LLSAPSFIFTKNGFVSVFVIKPTFTSPPPLLPLLLDELLLPLSLPQAATPAASVSAAAAATAERPERVV